MIVKMITTTNRYSWPDLESDIFEMGFDNVEELIKKLKKDGKAEVKDDWVDGAYSITVFEVEE